METAIHDHLKSDEDQMDMMMMMMQLPEFSSSYAAGDATVQGFPPPEFSGAANRTMPLSDLINDNTPLMPWSSSSSFTDQLPSNSATAIQPPLFPNSGKGSWRGAGAGDGAVPCGAASSAEKRSSMAAMREMIFRIAAMQPIHIDPESVKPPKRRNVKISKDPQSVAARHRRERISERIRILQRLVPGGTKMDTASMLDEAIHYVKFLKSQVQSLERAAGAGGGGGGGGAGMGFPVAMSSRSATAAALPLPRRYQ